MSQKFSIDNKSTLRTTLAILNANPPISPTQFEIWYQRWPHVKWIANGITIPPLKTNTADIHFDGFSVPIIVNTNYGNNDIEMEIIADEDGMYYDQWRTLILEYSADMNKGRPILSYSQEDVVVKLHNPTENKRQGHCWNIHNFKPTELGDVQMGHDKGGDLLSFTVSGTFTHISYTNDKTDELLKFAAGMGETTPKKPANSHELWKTNTKWGISKPSAAAPVSGQPPPPVGESAPPIEAQYMRSIGNAGTGVQPPMSF